ncbi:MAG: DUF4956 domain-containing protein [Lachnospiraceae bacterium]|nr:DUF4956 domain-containing protein [Lachnospiraceae bacterium]
MSVKDVVKKSILESEMYNQAISVGMILTIVADILAALLLGILIYQIYKRFYRGVVYSRNYAITLIGMTVLTCMVTLAISTNIVISLGMVGALSIVRYRTAIKEPLDLMYMFWAITTGIAVGASMYILVVIAAVVMIGMIAVSGFGAGNQQGYMMVVHYQGDETGDEIEKMLHKVRYRIRSKIFRGENVEMTLQLKCKRSHLVFAEKIKGMKQVQDVALLEFDGEYHG